MADTSEPVICRKDVVPPLEAYKQLQPVTQNKRGIWVQEIVFALVEQAEWFPRSATEPVSNDVWSERLEIHVSYSTNKAWTQLLNCISNVESLDLCGPCGCKNSIQTCNADKMRKKKNNSVRSCYFTVSSDPTKLKLLFKTVPRTVSVRAFYWIFTLGVTLHLCACGVLLLLLLF